MSWSAISEMYTTYSISIPHGIVVLGPHSEPNIYQKGINRPRMGFETLPLTWHTNDWINVRY